MTMFELHTNKGLNVTDRFSHVSINERKILYHYPSVLLPVLLFTTPASQQLTYSDYLESSHEDTIYTSSHNLGE